MTHKHAVGACCSCLPFSHCLAKLLVTRYLCVSHIRTSSSLSFFLSVSSFSVAGKGPHQAARMRPARIRRHQRAPFFRPHSVGVVGSRVSRPTIHPQRKCIQCVAKHVVCIDMPLSEVYRFPITICHCACLLCFQRVRIFRLYSTQWVCRYLA